MAAELKAQLNAFVAEMVAAGLVSEQFHQLHNLQDGSTPGFVPDLFELFCNEGEPIICRITQLLSQPVVDFSRLATSVHQLVGNSGCVGALKVNNASTQLRDFCEQKNIAGCFNALETARAAFYEVRDKFRTVIQLERLIQRAPAP